MKKPTRHPHFCHPLSDPPLFGSRPPPVLNGAPGIAHKLSRRYGITVEHATVVAHLAGLGSEASR
jgi:hypothetical protein